LITINAPAVFGGRLVAENGWPLARCDV